MRFCAGLWCLFFFLIGPLGAQAADEIFSVASPQKSLSVGEKLVYQIYYLGVPVGQSSSEVKEIVTFAGRQAYHIVVKVHSYRTIDLIYKVRDEHHSYIDVGSLASLGYEKNISEGHRRIYERMEFDQELHRARYLDEKGKVLKELAVLENTQDQLSCGYWVRTQEILENHSLYLPVHADQKNWDLEVKFHERAPVSIKGVGRFEAIRMEPLMEFQGIFIRRGKVEGWMSLDKKRVPLKMKVKIPVLGNVTAEMRQYEPGKEVSL